MVLLFDRPDLVAKLMPFFNFNVHFKRPSAIRPDGECAAPAGLRQN
jgi:hypothetical protein